MGGWGYWFTWMRRVIVMVSLICWNPETPINKGLAGKMSKAVDKSWKDFADVRKRDTLGSLDEGNSSLIVQCGGETVLSAADKKNEKRFCRNPKKFYIGFPWWRKQFFWQPETEKLVWFDCQVGRKKEKSFCKIGETMLHCCPLIQQGSSLNLLLSERQSQLLCSCLQLKVYQPDQTELNSTTESLILAQDERWRRA